MNNTINGRTPEEIKKGLECGYCEDCSYREYRGRNCTGRSRADALAYIQQLERERDAAVEQLKAAQPKWISVEERLPEPYYRYIVAIKLKYAWETEWERVVDVACMVPEGGYIEGQWDTFNDWDEGQEIHVTHWMPLPEPPKEEE